MAILGKIISISDKSKIKTEDCFYCSKIVIKDPDYYVALNQYVEFSIKENLNDMLIGVKISTLINNLNKVQRLCDFLFVNNKNINKICICVLNDERFIKRLLHRSGFIKELEFKNISFFSADPKSLEIYSLFRG